ncbi:MAG: hypothetical protein ABIX28_14300, partial [Vicinamibacterales bacterium]
MRIEIALLSFIVAVSAPLSMRTATRPAESTTITLSSTVTTADKGWYQEHPFDVPAGVTRIDIDFAYD